MNDPSLGLGGSGAYKRAHPEKAREYARRSNEKRPDRDRAEHAPCDRCGGPRKRRGNQSGLCANCLADDRTARSEKARALRAEGLTFTEIGNELGIPAMTAWRSCQ